MNHEIARVPTVRAGLVRMLGIHRGFVTLFVNAAFADAVNHGAVLGKDV